MIRFLILAGRTYGPPRSLDEALRIVRHLARRGISARVHPV